jgi:hypothetical protein
MEVLAAAEAEYDNAKTPAIKARPCPHIFIIVHMFLSPL